MSRVDSENIGQYIEEEKSREPILELTYEQECYEQPVTAGWRRSTQGQRLAPLCPCHASCWTCRNLLFLEWGRTYLKTPPWDTVCSLAFIIQGCMLVPLLEGNPCSATSIFFSSELLKWNDCCLLVRMYESKVRLPFNCTVLLLEMCKLA